MKPEEVIRAIDLIREIDINTPITQVDITNAEWGKEMAIEALEKQVPKKPIICGENPDGTYQFKCPECGRLWWEKSYITKYCDKCGNLIDRSEKDES